MRVLRIIKNKNTLVHVSFYLFTVGFRKCRIIYGRINETPLYIQVIFYRSMFHFLLYSIANNLSVMMFYSF